MHLRVRLFHVEMLGQRVQFSFDPSLRTGPMTRTQPLIEVTATPKVGTPHVLYLRASFSDDVNPDPNPQSSPSAGSVAKLSQTRTGYLHNSFNQLDLQFDVAHNTADSSYAYIQMPGTRADYFPTSGTPQGGWQTLPANVKAQAQQLYNTGHINENPSAYDYVIEGSPIADYASGSNRIYALPSSRIAILTYATNAANMMHEFGHLLSLFHSAGHAPGSIQTATDDDSPIAPGKEEEYNDPFSFMGRQQRETAFEYCRQISLRLA